MRSGSFDRESQADRAAPVLNDDCRVAEIELVDEPLDRGVVKVVGVVLDPGRLVRATEAEVVGRDDACDSGERRDQLPVEERPRRLAVEEEDRFARALVDVVHSQSVLLEVARLECVAGKTVEALVGRAV